MQVLLRSVYLSLPEEPGIYLFLGKDNRILYVGKARNLKKRVTSYFANKSLAGEKTRQLTTKIDKIKFLEVRNEIEALLLEANYVKKYQPLYNVKLTDGKAYPLIRITIRDKYPKVLIARRMDDQKSLYFGPYPNPSSMHLVLQTIRKIFPFQSVNNHPKKTCLYYHLGLCPCPPVFDSEKLKKNYRKNILRIILFLNGKLTKVIEGLKKEREAQSKNEDFEGACVIQRKIDAVTLITKPVMRPFEYEINPNLKSDLIRGELEQLKNELKKSGVKVKTLRRIECYDISNINGRQAAGSMVVFINGEKEKSEYRKFKINQSIPNDVLMIYELLLRRLKHREWNLPDLIMIDGGKGQVSLAKKAINEHGLKIPIIGLTKKEETIITSDFKKIRLPKDSPALHLLQRIRDEAHRFAISYHRKLRSKSTFL